MDRKVKTENNGKESRWQILVRTNVQPDPWIAEFDNGISLEKGSDGYYEIRGTLPDISSVYGLILQIRDSGIDAISIYAEKIEGRRIL